jgi:hypothetical protein
MLSLLYLLLDYYRIRNVKWQSLNYASQSGSVKRRLSIHWPLDIVATVDDGAEANPRVDPGEL